MFFIPHFANVRFGSDEPTLTHLEMAICLHLALGLVQPVIAWKR